jgi:RNA polymerase sigma-70 factor (ECF subfamily)
VTSCDPIGGEYPTHITTRYTRGVVVDEPQRGGPRSGDEAEVEAAVRSRLAADDVAGATTLAVQHYGPQILGYLVAMARDQVDAHDAFARFCVALWRGLPGFRWRSSLRTWSYVLARNALHRERSRSPARHGPHLAPVDAPELAALAEQVRTATAEYRRTATKSRFARLRDQLDPDDRTLLILRVDRRMGWREIAEVLGEPTDAADLQRRAAGLRKRFERLKTTLRELLRGDDDG